MARYVQDIAEHRRQADQTKSYSPVVAYPSAAQAAIALEQGVVQDVFDVYQDVLTIRNGTVPLLFIPKEPNSNASYWAIAKFSPKFKALFQQSLGRLKREGDSVGIAFAPPPSGDNQDNNVWPCRIVMRDVGFRHSGDLVLDCRRPNAADTASLATSQKVVRTVDDWDQGEKNNV